MSQVNRRQLLAGATVVGAGQFVSAFGPALGAVPASGEVDVAIIGAGAAGIAAARRIAAAKRRYALIEAADVIGGRCVTDTATFGVPYDRGAHWIHLPQSNPVLQLANRSDVTIDNAPRGLRMRVGARAARETELEDYFANLVRANRAIVDAGRGRADVSALSALPRDLGDWQNTIEFSVGPYSVGKELARVSAADMARATERGADVFSRQGYGAMLAGLAAGLSTQLSTPVRRVSWDRGLVIETTRGVIEARAAIVTVSTNVLAANVIAFKPELPKRQLDAAAALSLGSYDHVAFDIPGNPLGLDRDDLVIEKSSGPGTAALLANIGGTSLCTVDLAGMLGADLSRRGSADMIAFARDWLKRVFGSNVTGAIRKAAATQWNENPWVRGAFSAAAPGGADARRVLAEPLGGKLWFAGEAVHEQLWGTVNGAWDSGHRAAEAALRRIGALDVDEKDAPRRRRQRR